jgi:DNA-binding winged helix-turn-helix (wHTH) protein/TolB-like protein
MSPILKFGRFQLDRQNFELLRDGQPVKLDRTPLELLLFLAEHSGKLVTRDEAVEHVWGKGVFIEAESSLYTAIRKIRQALGDDAGESQFIQTVSRKGYRFIATVEEMQSASPGPTVARRRRLQWIAAGAGGAITAIVIALFLWQFRHPAVSRVGSTSAKAIAVLPFQNAGSDKDTDFLRLALPDEIATTLSYVPWFSIRPFATTSKYNVPNFDLQQAGREMGVTTIVTGHYLTEGNQLEVTLEAVDVANNRSVWRDTVSVAASDKIAMREQITSRVRQRLVPALGGLPARQDGTRPTSEESYDLYLRSVGVPHDVSPNKAAITMLERAVDIDTSYAPAWEALGIRYYYEADYGEGGPPMLKRSDSALERALTLDPNLIAASVQLINNRTERGELRDAYAEASALIKRRPDSAEAHFAYAYVLRYAGLLDESGHECDTALALDRSDYRFRSCSIPFMQLGQLQKALEFVRLDAGSEFAARQTALILLGQSKIEEARQAIQRASDAPQIGGPLLQVCLDPKQASRLDGVARQTEAASVAEGDAEGFYIAGTMLSYCGQKDAALRLLRRAVGQNYCAYDALRTDPLLMKLRRSPEFSGLLSAAKECQNKFLAQRDPH